MRAGACPFILVCPVYEKSGVCFSSLHRICAMYKMLSFLSGAIPPKTCYVQLNDVASTIWY